ncbi:MAG: M3 family oligoendopeptidase [Elusimicrobiota bacterium]
MDKINWNLDDIMPLRDFDSLCRETRESIEKFKGLFLKAYPEMKAGDFVRLINLNEHITELLSKLHGRAALMEAADQSLSEPKVLKGRAKDLELEASSKMRSFFNWIKGKKVKGKSILDEKNARRLFGETPQHSYKLNYMRKLARHTLSSEKEEIIEKKDAYGIEAVTDLRTLIESDFTFTFAPEGRKAKEINTQAELAAYTRSPEAKERKAAYTALLEKYKSHINYFYTVYSSVVKDWVFEASLRNYSSPLSVRNAANHINDRAVQKLLESCSANRKIYQQYFKFKARHLKTEKLSRFDLYAPLGGEKENISFKEGVDIVLDALGEFSGGFKDRALEIISSKHIDSHPEKSKTPGAFCATISPSIAPYILLNHTRTKRDVLTLAHELGHGIHSLYSNHLPCSVQHSVLPLAETASTFCEMLVFEKLLESSSQKQKKKMLSDKLSESYATVIRQNYFVKFEMEIHDKIKKGLSPEDISDIYFSTLKEQFEDSVLIDSLFRYEWAYIPHIVHTPFYCYSYNFGELLSLSLYAFYKSKGPSFKEEIIKILSAGGSMDPALILKEAGADINSRLFWDKGFDIIKGWMQKLND